MAHPDRRHSFRQPHLIWVDARLKKTTASLFHHLPASTEHHRIVDISHATNTVDSAQPRVVVFDFDYADITGLRTLKNMNEQYPNIPFLMLAEQHYEQLSIWALRCRIWDYMVKPISVKTLTKHLEILTQPCTEQRQNTQWRDIHPPCHIPQEAALIGAAHTDSRIHAAISYIEEHLHEKISAQDVSNRCGLSRYELSRVFQSAQGMNFRDYLRKKRIERAERMLAHTCARISDIALSVGFSDLSHFTRSFKDHHGYSPKQYREKSRP